MSTEQDEVWDWWQEKRFGYNAMLVVAMILSNVFLLIIVVLGGKYLPEVEFTILSMFALVFVIPVVLLLANLCYTSGAMLEYLVKPTEPEPFRNTVYKAGCGFSLLVVFYPPLISLAKVIWRSWYYA